MNLRQTRLPLDARPKVTRLAPWRVAPEVEAAAMLDAERKNITKMKQTFFDQILNSIAHKGDVVKLAHSTDGNLHIFVNGEHRGHFVAERQGLVFKSV